MANIELPLEYKHCREIKEKFQEKFLWSKSAWRLALDLIPENKKVGVGKGGFLTLCLTASYVKTLRLFYSIYRLCELGLADESNLQLRTMLELYVKLKYLSSKVTDKDDFARQWAIWCVANDVKFIDGTERCFPGGKKDERFSEWRRWIKEESGKVDSKTWTCFVREGPWVLRFQSLCDEVGLKNDVPMYSIMSGTAHGYDLFKYARKVDDVVSELDLTPISRGVDTNLTISVALLHSSLNLINMELGLEKEKTVEEIGLLARTMMGRP